MSRIELVLNCDCLFAEFDKFLAARAKEVEEQPPSEGARGNTRGGRLMQKGDADNSLFAL